MKRTLSMIYLIVLIFVLAACNAVAGDGNVTTEEFDVSGFNRIEFSGVGDVYITLGESESVSLTTDSNLQKLMRVEVEGNTLHIGQQPNTSMYNSTELTFNISLIELESISVSGAGDVYIEDMESSAFSVNISGAADIFIEDLDLESLNVDISGSGSATADGRADEVRVVISGAGTFSAYDLTSENANIDISGSGSAEVTVNNELTGSVSGAGDISYRGNPDVNVNVSGAGEVEADN